MSMSNTARWASPSLAEAFIGPRRWTSALVGVAAVVAGAAAIAASAQVAFRVPWTPVPYTLQTGTVLLAGILLGPRRGLATVALYLLAGAVGLPVFAAGHAGLAYMAGPTAGYLAGFALAALLVGALVRRGLDRGVRGTVALMLVGSVAVYAVGVPVLALTTGLSLPSAVDQGALVFVPWDLAKVAVAAAVLPILWRAVGRS